MSQCATSVSLPNGKSDALTPRLPNPADEAPSTENRGGTAPFYALPDLLRYHEWMVLRALDRVFCVLLAGVGGCGSAHESRPNAGTVASASAAEGVRSAGAPAATQARSSARPGGPGTPGAATNGSLAAAPSPASVALTAIRAPSGEAPAIPVPEARIATPTAGEPPPSATSVSKGSPNDGSLEGGVALPMQAPGLRYNPRRRPEARYGTTQMVSALLRAAGVVAREMPGSELTVNDLGYEKGGPIEHHGSHQSGRDVDVLFYFLDKHGKPAPAVGAPVEPNGKAIDFQNLAIASDDIPLRIDLPRTWRFVQALIEDRQASLQRIFLVEHLRTLLLEQAAKAGAPASTIERFADMTCQPSTPHDDHFHFRFYCDAGDIARGCEDTKPLYPWRIAELEALGLEAVLTNGHRRKAMTTSDAEARAAAGKLHPKVVAFLERRKTWSTQPHPGRRYCR